MMLPVDWTQAKVPNLGMCASSTFPPSSGVYPKTKGAQPYPNRQFSYNVQYVLYLYVTANFIAGNVGAPASSSKGLPQGVFTYYAQFLATLHTPSLHGTIS